LNSDDRYIAELRASVPPVWFEAAKELGGTAIRETLSSSIAEISENIVVFI